MALQGSQKLYNSYGINMALEFIQAQPAENHDAYSTRTTCTGAPSWRSIHHLESDSADRAKGACDARKTQARMVKCRLVRISLQHAP